VILRGEDHPTAVRAAIDNGTPFSAAPLDGGVPGGCEV
jgi:hypothetical protein